MHLVSTYSPILNYTISVFTADETAIDYAGMMMWYFSFLLWHIFSSY